MPSSSPSPEPAPREINPVSPNAILNTAADAQRDLSRLPMHPTPLSDEPEVAIERERASRRARVYRRRHA